MTDKQILDNHPYAIWQSKDGKYWYTQLGDRTKPRGVRQLKRNSKKELNKAIIDWYKQYPAGIKFDNYLGNDMLFNTRKIIADDFKIRKKLDFYDIKSDSYEINCIGEVYSLKRNSVMVSIIHNQRGAYEGQEYVKLSTNSGGVKYYSVAKLVLTAFVGTPPDNMVDPTVDHIDHCSINNYYRNLRWLERSVNSSLHEKIEPTKECDNGNLLPVQVAEICNAIVKNMMPLDYLAEKYRVPLQTICDIKNKKIWNYITTWFDFD